MDQRPLSGDRVPGPHQSLEEVDPKLLETYQKLGIPLSEQNWLTGVAVDAVFDSVGGGAGAPELVKKYLGSVWCPTVTTSSPPSLLSSEIRILGIHA